jgi:hypothetical protein
MDPFADERCGGAWNVQSNVIKGLGGGTVRAPYLY